MTNDEQGIKSIHVELPSELHKRLKVLVAIRDQTMKGYARVAIEEKMARDDEQLRSGRAK